MASLRRLLFVLATIVAAPAVPRGVLSNVPYDFRTRFENEKGTNPEEQIAAAHAACHSMALSKILGDAGMKAESISTRATVTLDQADGGFAVTSSALETRVKIPNADQPPFRKPRTRPRAAARSRSC